MTRAEEALAGLTREQRKLALANYSRHPKGVKRAAAPRFSIWPADRVTSPTRMGAK